MDAGVSSTFHLDLENMLATTLKVDAALSCRVNGIEEHWRSTFRVLILGLQPRSTYRALILGATRTIRKSSCGLHPRSKYRAFIWRAAPKIHVPRVDFGSYTRDTGIEN